MSSADAVQLLAATALYFVIVFGVGFLLGPIRVLWLEPSLGKTVAVLCETPLLLIAMILAARWTPARVGLCPRHWMLAAVGIRALALQQIADFGVGVFLRGMSPAEQLANFKTPAGIVYAMSLAAFMAMHIGQSQLDEALSPATALQDRVVCTRYALILAIKASDTSKFA